MIARSGGYFSLMRPKETDDRTFQPCRNFFFFWEVERSRRLHVRTALKFSSGGKPGEADDPTFAPHGRFFQLVAWKKPMIAR